ncbi:TetR/AcrR family transcriptional regulator [Agromyces sp. SYSU T00266]|uniref:TetR/AcrR family transcriptional regulator n=1 Tax=Agromyces zhanjiangensis TaxID=3158562 RepID=UPI003391B276
MLDAAARLFTERGERTVSMRDIATAAGLSAPAIFRHFTTKDDLVGELLGNAEMDVGTLAHPQAGTSDARGDERATFLTAIAGEATAARHPAHELMRARYASGVSSLAATLQNAREDGEFGAQRDPTSSARWLIAGFDGLRIMHSYLGAKIDIAGMMTERRGHLALDHGSSPLGFPPGAPADEQFSLRFTASRKVAEEVVGYAAGRARRDRIVNEAMALFATSGYGDTSLREVAERVGVTKSALFHHFGTKSDLLEAVLLERDARTVATVQQRSHPTARAALLALPEDALQNSVMSAGLVELYAILSCEAMPRDHAAHEYFADRFQRSIGTMATAFRRAADDGDLPQHLDPDREAIWLVALWDGLQIQWLYDKAAIDVSAELALHLTDILPSH